jgi:hypothetical protein
MLAIFLLLLWNNHEIQEYELICSLRRCPRGHSTAQAEQFSFDVDVPGLIQVINDSHENLADHQYTVSIDNVTDELMACTCPHPVHRNTFCKHMAAIEISTDAGTLNAFPSEDNRINGPYTGYDKYGTADHTYWTCEECGAEATRKDALTDCC